MSWVAPWFTLLGCDRGQVDFLFSRDGGKDYDLAVAHAAGPSDFDDASHRFVDTGVVDPKVDFDLGQKGQAELAFAVLIEVTLLATEAFDLADRACFQRSSPEAFENLLGEIRSDDGDDLFHVGLGGSDAGR